MIIMAALKMTVDFEILVALGSFKSFRWQELHCILFDLMRAYPLQTEKLEP